MVKASAASGLGFVLAAALLSATFVTTIALVACSSSDSSEFPGDPPKPDAEADGPGSFLPDTGTADGEAGTVTCAPKLPDPFTPAWKAPTKSSACTTEELGLYFAACVQNPGKTEADGTCAKFKTDHASCGACAEPADNSGPIQWLLGRKLLRLNIAGCIAVEQEGTDAGASGCGEAYNAAVQCTRESCYSCITDANSNSLFNECQKKVTMQGICKSYETAQGTACQGYKNAGSPALACFPSSAEQTELAMTGVSESFYSRVVGATCGP
jgi:hypothetical protein